MTVNFNVVLADAAGAPITNAIVQVHSHTRGYEAIEPTTRQVDGGGFANLYSGEAWPENVQFDLTVIAAGYAPWTSGADPVSFGAQGVEVRPKLVPFV